MAADLMSADTELPVPCPAAVARVDSTSAFSSLLELAGAPYSDRQADTLEAEPEPPKEEPPASVPVTILPAATLFEPLDLDLQLHRLTHDSGRYSNTVAKTECFGAFKLPQPTDIQFVHGESLPLSQSDAGLDAAVRECAPLAVTLRLQRRDTGLAPSESFQVPGRLTKALEKILQTEARPADHESVMQEPDLDPRLETKGKGVATLDTTLKANHAVEQEHFETTYGERSLPANPVIARADLGAAATFLEGPASSSPVRSPGPAGSGPPPSSIEPAPEPAATKQKVDRIDIHLETPDRGRVQIELADRRGGVHVSLRATEPASIERIREGMPDLRNHLETAGFHAESWLPETGTGFSWSGEEMASGGSPHNGDQERHRHQTADETPEQEEHSFTEMINVPGGNPQ